jgi:hypothetical protein
MLTGEFWQAMQDNAWIPLIIDSQSWTPAGKAKFIQKLSLLILELQVLVSQ